MGFWEVYQNKKKRIIFQSMHQVFCDYVAYFGLIGYVGQIIESAEQMI